jgi:hypothetical protein
VVGANAGNVAYLLTDSGTALPEEAAAWAAEVARLVGDDAHHAARSEAGSRNAALLSSRHQAEGLARLFAALRRRILVAVGSGVGNLCHQTPVVRRLAEHYGAPVDVLVNGDFPGCSALFSGAPWVASACELPGHALTRT